MASLRHLLVLVSLCLGIATCSTAGEVKPPKVRLYVFGDALFDAGNGVYNDPSSRYSKLPYGMSIQNKDYGTGRISDGLLIPDFIASFANLGIIPPSKKVSACDFKKGINFASNVGGALEIPNRMNLKQQQESFMSMVEKSKAETGPEETRKMLSDSVFLIGFGPADYYTYFSQGSGGDKTALANRVTESISRLAFDIYRQGGRKFAFTNVMALGCVPAIKETKNVGNTQCYEPLNDLPRKHNIALVNAANKLQMQLPGFNYTIFDLYSAFHPMMISPVKYGFTSGDNKACCGRGARRGHKCGIKPFDLCPNPSKFVFFGGYMPSQEANRQLATLFWSGGANVAAPYNLKSFFPDANDYPTASEATEYMLDQSA